jgi:outer membrane protein assembly factor BamB
MRKGTMKKRINKTKLATAVCILLMASITASILLIPETSAHTPAWEITTYAYINVSPDPIGVGQKATVVVWLDKIPAGAAIGNDIRFHDYKLTITDPDGDTDIITWPIVYDTTSSANTFFTPDKVGTYTLKFEFPGQEYTWTDPIPQIFGPPLPNDYTNDTYLASSATTTLTVQDEEVTRLPGYPLPTEYWTRPIEGENTGWASISSNYLAPFGAAFMYGSERFQPDGTAPGSPHIMWTKPIQFGGVVGGSNVGVQGNTFYTGLSYQARYSGPIIMYGRLYYSLPRGDSSSGDFMGAHDNGYVCVDLRTGKQIWWKDYSGVNPSFGQLLNYQSPNQHGVIPNGYLWAVSGTTWIAYDPWDGNWLFDLTDVPSGTNVYGPNGEILRYQLDVANKRLALWNYTHVFADPTFFGGSGYRPVNQVINASHGYSWNVSIPELPAGSAIRQVILDDLVLGSTTVQSDGEMTVWAISIKESSRGTLLWSKTYPAVSGDITRRLVTADPETRVFTISYKETRQWLGYDLDSGNLLWGPVGDARDFNYYATVGSGGVSQVGWTAYGNLYTSGYGGELFCYALTDGTLLWKYNNTDSGFETPYGLYPLFIGAIADGKIYLYNNEHSPETPMYKDARVRCVNATTGEELWTMLGWAGVGSFADEGWPVADGYISYLNTYDMQVYCLGKGPSSTTVTAPDVAADFGTPVVIKGTVIDIAAGTTQDEQAARFPNGVPAVSDESQGEWMEYVYMQKPRPSDTVGVNVTLDVLDSNGNYRNIGTATTDSSGTFSFVWTPDIPGKFTVIASFEGSESYWPSWAETAFYTMEAVEPTPPPTPSPAPLTDTYVAGFGIAVIIILVAGIAVIVLMLRKR